MTAIWQEGLGRALFAALIALFATLLALVLLRPVAVSAGLIDHPTERKAHGAPTPAFGGLAIVVGVAPLVLFLLPLSPQIRGFATAAVIVLVEGAADDRWRIRWQYRIAAQVAAAFALIYIGGVRIDHIGMVLGFPNHNLGPLSTPLTVLATVGILNAVNMADGVDGLAGAVCLVSFSLLAAAALYSGNARLADGLILLMGGLCAFLLFNLRTPWNPRAHLFIGNAGAEFLGLVIACASFRLTQNPLHPVGPRLAPFLIAPPLIDCLALIALRVKRGQSPFHADRNHLHHLMLEAGYSTTAIVVIISGATLAIGVAAALALKAHAPAPLFTAVFLALLIGHIVWSHQREHAVARLTWLRELAGFRSQRPPDPAPVHGQLATELMPVSTAKTRLWLAPADDLGAFEADPSPVLQAQSAHRDDGQMHV